MELADVAVESNFVVDANVGQSLVIYRISHELTVDLFAPLDVRLELTPAVGLEFAWHRNIVGFIILFRTEQTFDCGWR